MRDEVVYTDQRDDTPTFENSDLSSTSGNQKFFINIHALVKNFLNMGFK